ncbi:MAG TPA: hypothetical protein VKG43_10795 [Acidimicrobiales bacterium]|nr:hypothetical protein [Acidimicrobiales bacterium]
MTPDGPPAGAAEDGRPDDAPPPAFVAELKAAFRRLAPQGSVRWNFSDAFTRLESLFGEPVRRSPLTGSAPPPSAPAPAATGGGWGVAVRQSFREAITRWTPTDGERGTTLADERVAQGFDATVEALRFLGARVEELEAAASRRTRPVDGLSWLAPTPDLTGWVAPVLDWLGAHPPAGPVVHAEAGEGALTAALAAAGMAAEGVEPRGELAWAGAARGLEMHVQSAPGYLAGCRPEEVGGLVLSGCPDHLGLDALVDLLDLVADRLAPGAPLVVIGLVPGAEQRAWSPAAQDLLPGRPRHPQTWELLLTRRGLASITPLRPADGADGQTHALGAVRPR